MMWFRVILGSDLPPELPQDLPRVSDRYQKELSKITHAKNIPFRMGFSRSTLPGRDQVVGQYSQVIPLSRSRKQIQK